MIYDDPSVANSYDEHFKRRVDRAEDRALDLILGNLSSSRVLDLGCGTGALLDRKAVRSYVGVDASPAMISTTLRKHCGLFRAGMPPIHETAADPARDYVLAVGDASLPPSEWMPVLGPADKLYESVDLAVSLFAFPYFTDQASALHVAYHALQPGGRLVVQAFTRRYLRRRHALDVDPSTVTPSTPAALTQIAHNAGFTDVQIHGFRYVPDWLANLLPVKLGARVSRLASNVLPATPAMTLLLTARKSEFPVHPNCRHTMVPIIEHDDRRLPMRGITA